MQEEVTQRTIALCVEATKLSAGMLQQAMKKVLDEMQKGVTGHKTKLHHGAEICGFVLPEYRNNNIGNYLMEKLSYEMEDFYISIPVAKDNKTAPNFLRTNGYYPGTTELPARWPRSR